MGNCKYLEILFITILLFLNIIGLTVESKIKSNKQDKHNSSFDMLTAPDKVSHITVVRSEGLQINPEQIPSNYNPSYYHKQYHTVPSKQTNSHFMSTKKFDMEQNSKSFDPAILGSGNFEIISGGLFYPDGEKTSQLDSNKHKQYLYENKRARADRKYTDPDEQFANFHDFADLKIPREYQPSHFIKIFADKNATVNPLSPRNILEKLELIDEEKKIKQNFNEPKVKLEKWKLLQNLKKRNTKRNEEPLLAMN